MGTSRDDQMKSRFSRPRHDQSLQVYEAFSRHAAVIQTCFKSTTDIQNDKLQVNTLTVNEIETPTPKEPEKALEDEFADLHLNLPVLEVLAHVPIYNALLDKHIVSLELGKLRLFKDFHAVDMERELTYPLLVGRGFLAIANAVIDCKKAKIAVGEGLTRTIFGVRELDFGEESIPDAEVNPFKDILVFRKMVEFLGTIPINLKGNMCESENVIDDKMGWNKPPKEGDGAWHIRIELIDPDGENFDRVFQSIPTTRKLSTKANLSDILNLDHFNYS
ncbi:hypothetical protein Tco_0111571 [Tanacetum coccineum]